MNVRRLLSLTTLGVVLVCPLVAEETPFQTENRLLTQSLPCKWLAMGGRTGPSYGSGRFDFSCKGGTWGTVTLLMNAEGMGNQSLGAVRLGYRDWDPAVNPTAGEAMVAEQFLQFVLGRYVPASQAAAVREAFWQGNKGTWREGSTKATIATEAGAGFTQRWLSITGPYLGQGQTQGQSQTMATNTGLFQWQRSQSVVPAAIITPTDGGLLKPTEAASPAATILTPLTPQAPVQLPNPALIPQQGVRATAPLQVPANAPAGTANNRGAAPQSFLESAAHTLRGLAGLPATSSPSAPLPVAANPSRLNTAPEPESLEKPLALPAISASLIPSVETVGGNRPLAPSNFAAYNEAEQRTKEIEARAIATTLGLSPTVSPVGAPVVNVASDTLNIAPLQAPQPATAATTPAAPAAASTAAPTTQDPRFAPTRTLPQLRFIPKAEPLDTRGEVIKFEDEGQAL